MIIAIATIQLKKGAGISHCLTEMSNGFTALIDMIIVAMTIIIIAINAVNNAELAHYSPPRHMV